MDDIEIKCGKEIYYIKLYWDDSYEIEIIDVKPVYVGYKTNINRIVTASSTNDMEFIVKMVGKKGNSNNMNYINLDVDFLNVPTLSNVAEIYLKFDVTYIIDNKIKNKITNEITIVHTTSPYEIDNKFKSIKDSPYGLKLDSIYRPFFVNCVLLLLPYEYETQNTSKDYSQDCFGKLYFSIANGCTYRVNDKEKYNENSIYKIGDINIKLKHGTDYNLTIRDSYRIITEMYDNDNPVYGYWHLNGIREAGENDISIGLVNDFIKLKRGINLLPDVNNTIISPISTIYENYKVSSITYNNNEKLTNYDKISDDNCGLDTTYPIQFSLTINDYAPIGYEPNTINIESESILFPDEIKRDTETKCSFDSRYYNENVTYIAIGQNDDKDGDGKRFNDINNIFEKISKIDVTDNAVEGYGGTFLFDYLFNEYKDNICKFKINGDNGRYEETNLNKGRQYIIAIYHGSNIKSDDNNPFSYIKHTNKVLIMKVYNIRKK